MRTPGFTIKVRVALRFKSPEDRTTLWFVRLNGEEGIKAQNT
jgi:hypothetical protein